MGLAHLMSTTLGPHGPPVEVSERGEVTGPRRASSPAEARGRVGSAKQTEVIASEGQFQSIVGCHQGRGSERPILMNRVIALGHMPRCEGWSRPGELKHHLAAIRIAREIIAWWWILTARSVGSIGEVGHALGLYGQLSSMT